MRSMIQILEGEKKKKIIPTPVEIKLRGLYSVD